MADIIVNRKTAQNIVSKGKVNKRTHTYNIKENGKEKRFDNPSEEQNVNITKNNEIRMAIIYRDLTVTYPYVSANYIKTLQKELESETTSQKRKNEIQKIIDDYNFKSKEVKPGKWTTQWKYDEDSSLWKCSGYLIDKNGVNITTEKVDIYSLICVEPIYDKDEDYWGSNHTYDGDGWFYSDSIHAAGGVGKFYSYIIMDYFYYGNSHFRTTNTGLNQLSTQRFFVYYSQDRWNLLSKMDWLRAPSRRTQRTNVMDFNTADILSANAWMNTRIMSNP